LHHSINEAIDAGLEVVVKVDVFVDAQGRVGYGMDQRLIEATR